MDKGERREWGKAKKRSRKGKRSEQLVLKEEEFSKHYHKKIGV
jgi:hypothetical protein